MVESRTFLLVLGVVLAIFIASNRTTPTPLPTTAVATDGAVGDLLDDKTQWSVAFLVGIGNGQPSLDVIAFVNAWQNGEHGDGRLLREAYNPLATTHTMPGNGCWNYSNGKCHVKIYSAYEEGLEANIRTVTNGRYPNILEGLQTNNAEQAFNADELGVWGTGIGNVERTYDAELERLIALFTANRPSGVESPRPGGGRGGPDESTRMAVVNLALSQVGKPYILGTEGPDTFDCSGLVQWVYGHYGIDTTRTTFTQLDALPAILPEEVQTGDMVYFQYPWDQHVGILFVAPDGTWSMVHAAAPGLGVTVTPNVFDEPFYTDAIIGYRRAL